MGQLLLYAGRIAGHALYAAFSEPRGVPYVRLGEFDVDPEALLVLPLAVIDARLVVATS